MVGGGVWGGVWVGGGVGEDLQVIPRCAGDCPCVFPASNEVLEQKKKDWGVMTSDGWMVVGEGHITDRGGGAFRRHYGVIQH